MHASKSILSILAMLGMASISPSMATDIENETRQLLRGSASNIVEAEHHEHRELAFATSCSFYRVGRCIDSGDRDYPTWRFGGIHSSVVVGTCTDHCRSMALCQGFSILNDNECRLHFDAAAYNYNSNGELNALSQALPAGATYITPFVGDGNGGTGSVATTISIGHIDCYSCEL